VAGQALRAATLTVEDDRTPHSLHGYFLRPGRSDMPTILRVDRDRDGRSVSARRVTAIQDGTVIFTLSASFQVDGDGPEAEPGLPDGVPGPDELGPSAIVPAHPAFEVRTVSPANEGHGLADVYWARAREELPDDPSVHACVLAYFSDMGVGEGELADELLDKDEPSIDHAVWLHRPARFDDWVLFAMQPVSAQAGRGLYAGSIHRRDGALLATMAQEFLIRSRRLHAPG
jgi:acyl-CoA thioesterase-2